MRVGVPKEITEGERRVALIPDVARRLIEAGAEVWVEAGAGARAYFTDAAYEEAGVTLAGEPWAIYGESEIVAKVRKPIRNELVGAHEVEMMKEGTVLVGFLEPLTSPDLVRMLAERRITAFSVETIPRISRAQKMDALSSQANIAGYKAAVLAADTLSKLFPMLMTAAGTIAPARALILGAGVAGLQAIATCRRLGAVVEAFDIRPAVKEEVESLGARFLQVEMEADAELQEAGGYAKEISEEEQRRERELIHEHVKGADIVITTAQIPGRPAPLLITAEMVRDMKPGSVIVDLAAESGGNCEFTRTGERVEENGVIIMGPRNLPGDMAVNASQMYARNVAALINHLTPDGGLALDFEDEITRDSCITHDGRVVNERVQAVLEGHGEGS